jgi:hypothetical protein
MDKARLYALVHTAEGEAKEFYGAASRFIVSHPKLSAVMAFCAGLAVGALI